MNKCGVVIEKKFTEWLNPQDENHREAVAFYARNGELPLYFVPSGVWVEYNWFERVADAFGVQKESKS